MNSDHGMNLVRTVRRLTFVSDLILMVFILFPGQTRAQVAISFSAAGNRAHSASYSMESSLGQTMGGQTVSAHSGAGFGYWRLQAGLRFYYLWTFPVSDGWNMVSVAQTMSDYRTSVLFPQAISRAFSYEGEYNAVDTLVNGRGYWLKFGGNHLIFSKGEMRQSDSIPVNSDWNMIGSVSRPVAVSDIQQDPPGIISSGVFGYDGGYVVDSVIVPGRAYWVRVSRKGTLILNGGPTGREDETIDHEEVARLNELTISALSVGSAKRGQSARLYFGASGENTAPADRFDLPPIPPKGSFDVRFAENKYAAIFPGKLPEEREIPILVSADGGRVTVSWSIRTGSGPTYALVDRQSEGREVTHDIRGTGETILETGSGHSLYLRAVERPAVFGLYQNYPNPFNPSTSIRYDLPRRAVVTLRIYDILGREVAAPVDHAEKDPGQYTVNINAGSWASGVYFYRLEVGTARLVKRMVLVK